MSTRQLRKCFLKFVFAIGICLISSTIKAQEDLESGVVRRPLKVQSPHPRKPPPPPKTVYVNVPKLVYIRATPTTGTIFVTARPNAHVTVEPVRGGKGKEGVVPADENFFIFDELKPGDYRVAASLEGYKEDQKQVKVIANDPMGVSLNLEEILYQVTITTNVEQGEVRYAVVEAYSDPKTGELKYRTTPTGLPRLVEIKNYRAVLPELRKGTYGVDIRAQDPGFQKLLGTVSVPDAEEGANVTFKADLENVESTTEFSSLTREAWDIPSSWRFGTGTLTVNGPGVGIPRADTYLHYKSFELVSDVTMLDGKEVSFVVHSSANKQNYYLISISGPDAAEPHKVSFYLVKGGVPQLLQKLNFSESYLKTNLSFRVQMIVDEKIDVKVTDSQSGEYVPIALFTDGNRNFPIGAVGVAAKDERTKFQSFFVCHPRCQK